MKKYSSKLLVFATITALLLVSGGIYIYSKNKSNKTSNSTENSTINYSPPTEDEKSAADTQKEANVKQNDNDNQAADASQVKVFITYAGEENGIIEVNAFSNHYEDGKCTIVFTKDSLKLIRETPAFRDASTTICTNPLIKRADFPSSGEWDLKVQFTSPSLKSESVTQKITIS